MKHILYILPVTLFLFSTAYPQENPIQKFAADITTEELREHVKILASDEFEGRATGREGQKKAAAYILDMFKEIGLEGISGNKGPFYQEFSLVKSGWDEFDLISSSDTLKSNIDFLVTGPWREGDTSYPLVFVGYGAENENYSSYNNLELNGKIAVFISGEPQDKNGKYLTSNSYVPEYSINGYDKARIAQEKGAVGSIMIDSDNKRIGKLIRVKEKTGNREQFFLQGAGKMDKTTNGLIALGEENASGILPDPLKNLDKTRKKLNKGKNLSRLTGKTIRIRSHKGSNKISSENVIGFIRGSEYPDEYIIVTAHYDHLGKNEEEIFNGADDNASGTAAVIEIAEAFKLTVNSGFSPKRSIVFMPVSGEEIGLLGSSYYVENPVVPIEDTKAALNMDMIGRQDSYSEKDTSYVYLYVSDEKNSALDLVASKADGLAGNNMLTVMKYKSESDFRVSGSDHASFENKGVPVMYFYCGTHDDYHRPTDTWEKIDYNNMTRISRMVFVSAWELANK